MCNIKCMFYVFVIRNFPIKMCPFLNGYSAVEFLNSRKGNGA